VDPGPALKRQRLLALVEFFLEQPVVRSASSGALPANLAPSFVLFCQRPKPAHGKPLISNQ
jgi:hypothetical protein